MEGPRNTTDSFDTTSCFNSSNNNNNGAMFDHEMPQGESALDCVTGHSFMSLLCQPSPLRSTPDLNLHVNLPYVDQWNPTATNSSGRGFDNRPPGSFESDIFSSNSQMGILPHENSLNSHYFEHMSMLPDLEPYSTSQLAAFDFMDEDYSANFHAGYAQSENQTSPMEEILFGGRLICATPVDLNPVMSSNFSHPPLSYRDEVFSQVGAAISQNVNDDEQPVFPEADQYHLPPYPNSDWQINNIDQMYGNVVHRRIDFEFTTLENHESHPSEDEIEDDFDEDTEEDDETDDDVVDDMDVEIDRWSYEAVLAMQESVGYVSTGLDEDEISAGLRKKEYRPSSLGESVDDDAPCCSICLEEFEEGRKLGVLDCNHESHYDCIKQWLMKRNSCPLCRATGLIL